MVMKKKISFFQLEDLKLYQNPCDEGMNFSLLNNKYTDKEFGEIAYVKQTKEDSTVIDLGANIVFFTLLYAKQVGNKGKVYSFEPGPQSFSLLTKNVAINCFKNVVLINKAVAESNLKQLLYLCRTGESDNRLFNTEGEIRDSIEIDVVSLDQYLGDIKVDFIKMDIQGSEYLALKGMSNIIKSNPNLRVLIEYAPNCLKSCFVNLNDLFALIKSFGYKMFVLYEDKEIEEVEDKWLLSNVGEGKKYPHVNLILQKS
jgi:FkbM family methyltransferase